ncbi:uncharacterized protein LOC111386721 [Olea europaea var. sylvestris]|uniref:uncharacterized protein LOC111386721 n=1 Tax=Olea europaea var. sylvestris TaxID=158386 RepID=UPI000C1D8B90|nr:uncharacterized protein LOC111386721 [Olea europaea var. sylvestris]
MASLFSEQYRDGAQKFVELACKTLNSEMIRCPCIKCRNLKHHNYEIVYEHLIITCMDPTYTDWVFHGEKPNSENPHDGTEEYIQRLVSDMETPLYPSCMAFTKMSVSVAIFKHKAAHDLSDNGFNELIHLVRYMLPQNNTLPNSFYLMKKLVNTFNLGYEKIYACLNDCCLHRKELEHVELCPKCGCSRWKVNQQTKKVQKKIPAKVLRYFRIIPRLKRMFGIEEMAKKLRWHSNNKSSDGKMRHPIDSLGWKMINRRWPHFALDPRNIRLGLTTDGFNPFKDLNSKYSC